MIAAGTWGNSMNMLMPPSRANLVRNARLMAEDFRAGTALRRYFMVSQMASGTLLGACSAFGIAAGLAGLTGVYLGLLGAAGLCLVHSVGTWNVLKRRYQVRYQVW
jgi:hypothetical protein